MIVTRTASISIIDFSQYDIYFEIIILKLLHKTDANQIIMDLLIIGLPQ